MVLFEKAKNILRKLEVNRAVFYSVLTTGWSAFAGLLTILVIAYWLSADEQGFYYTFSSVLALQVFVELGLTTVIIQVTSHEWAFLTHEENGKIRGDERALSRLASLLRFSLKWYFVCGIVVIFLLSSGGYIFFLTRPHPEIEWQIPWLALCFVAGLTLMLSPFLLIIEGSNQIASIYSFRFVQGILTSLALIAGMLLGFGLYSLALSALVRFISSCVFIIWRHYNFIFQLLNFKIKERINWNTEVWPFQWKIAISWLSGYFIFSIFTPIMFYYHGPQVAGQMGMTWAITWMIVSFSSSWIGTRMPQLGILIANRQYEELDRLFSRLFLITVVISIFCSLIFWLLIYGLHIFNMEIKDRLLPILPITLLLIDRIILVMIADMALYLRAHKKEPMMIPSLIGALLAGTSTWLLGAAYGPMGAISGLLALDILWGMPSCYFVFSTCRKKWHVEEYSPKVFSYKRIIS